MAKNTKYRIINIQKQKINEKKNSSNRGNITLRRSTKREEDSARWIQKHTKFNQHSFWDYNFMITINMNRWYSTYSFKLRNKTGFFLDLFMCLRRASSIGREKDRKPKISRVSYYHASCAYNARTHLFDSWAQAFTSKRTKRKRW